MVLHRIHGQLAFECECGEVFETGEKDFDAARLTLRSEGWTTRFEDGLWVHRCPTCKPLYSPLDRDPK